MKSGKFSPTILLYALLGSLLVGCTFGYNFTGTKGTKSNIPQEGYINIPNFEHQALDGPPNLSITLTEKSKEYWQRNTGLSVGTTQNPIGQYTLEGIIEEYTIIPIAASSTGETDLTEAALNRLTIVLDVTYIPSKDSVSQKVDPVAKNFKLRQERDFSTELSQSEVEQTIVDEISDQLIIEMFNTIYGGGDW